MVSEQCKKVDKTSSKSKSPPKTGFDQRPLIEFPHFLRIIGPKHVKTMMQFVPSAIIYSITSLVLVSYMSEWKTVLQYFPYYNGKYPIEIVQENKNKEPKMENKNKEPKMEVKKKTGKTDKQAIAAKETTDQENDAEKTNNQ